MLSRQESSGVVFYRPVSDERIVFTTRLGGFSQEPFASLNLGYFVGDEPERVRRNRSLVSKAAGAPSIWAAPRQVHGNTVVVMNDEQDLSGCEADAVVVREAGAAGVVVTADCAPVILRGRAASAAVHVGWRGLVSGVVQNAVEAIGSTPRAVVGPCIGVCHYEVGPEVSQAFEKSHPDAPAFSRVREGRLYFDLPSAVVWALESSGADVEEGTIPCTYCDSELYSHRRDGLTGRQAALVWI